MSTNTRPIRLCILSEWFYPTVGGVEIHISNLLPKLAHQGIDVCVVTRHQVASSPKQEQVGAATIYRIPPKGPGRFKKWLMIGPAFVQLMKLRDQYDVIYVPGLSVLGIVAVTISKLLNKRCVLRAAHDGEITGSYFAEGLQQSKLSQSSPFVRIFFRSRNWLLKKADLFISISSNITREFVEGGISVSKIKKIPHGVDTQRFRPVSHGEQQQMRDKLGLPRNKKIVIFVGRIVYFKGLPVLVEAWKDIAAVYPNAHLVIAGPGVYDTCEQDMKAFVHDNNLSDSVTFPGSISNVHEYLQASDIFVIPSPNEPFGHALIEAMACGLPAIARSKGGPKDIITNHKDGLFANNVPEMYAALDTLLGDETLARSMGQAARATVLERYAIDTMIASYTAAFHAVTETP